MFLSVSCSSVFARVKIELQTGTIGQITLTGFCSGGDMESKLICFRFMSPVKKTHGLFPLRTEIDFCIFLIHANRVVASYRQDQHKSQQLFE